jgi:hypothetical protein
MITLRQGLWKNGAPGTVADFSLKVLAFVWQIIRLPIFALLILLEPIVGFILCGFALVGAIVSVILKVSGAAPNFPFWAALAISVGFYVAFFLYTVVVRLLAPQSPPN